MGALFARFLAPFINKIIQVAIPTALAWMMDKGAVLLQRWWALRQAAQDIREKNAAARDANKVADTPESRERAAKGLADRF